METLNLKRSNSYAEQLGKEIAEEMQREFKSR